MIEERSSRPANRQILEEAAEWFVEINQAEPDAAVRQRFDAWLRLSPEHIRAYLRLVPIWEEGAALDTHANGDPLALIAWAREETNVVPLAAARLDAAMQSAADLPARNPKRLPVWTAFAASALLLCIAAVLGARVWLEERAVYETAVGEQRLIALSDGSRVMLNSRSKLDVRLTGAERRIELLAGQALFRVAKDATRPFTVSSGDSSVRAIGTQFDVYRKRTGTVVTVVEGRVAVLPAKPAPRLFQAEKHQSEAALVVLTAGEQAVLSPAAPPKRRFIDTALVTAWTQQRLEFSRTPLAEVAEEFNRYNERQLLVQDAELEAFNVSGAFSSTDPASLLRFLRTQPGIEVIESPSAILISKK